MARIRVTKKEDNEKKINTIEEKKIIRTKNKRQQLSNKLTKIILDLINALKKKNYPLSKSTTLETIKPIVQPTHMSDQAYQQFTQRIGIGEAEKRIEGKIQDIKTNQNKEELDKTKTLINEKIESINDNLNDELDELKEGYKLGVQDVYHLGHDINQLKGLVKAYHKLIPMIERPTNYISCRINT